jgi:hypothetical protein
MASKRAVVEEIGDMRHFEDSRQLLAYLALVSSDRGRLELPVRSADKPLAAKTRDAIAESRSQDCLESAAPALPPPPQADGARQTPDRRDRGDRARDVGLPMAIGH